MTAPRWLRLFFGGPSLMLLLGMAFLVFITITFANLAIERSTAQADHNRANARVEQLEAQRSLLQHELDQSQGGQRLEFWAYRLFGWVSPGTKVIEGQEPPPAEMAPVEQPLARPAPFWTGWWQTLRQSLTNLRNWVEYRL